MKLAMINSGLIKKICSLESRTSQGRKRFFKTVKGLVKQYFVISYFAKQILTLRYAVSRLRKYFVSRLGKYFVFLPSSDINMTFF